MPTFRSKEIVDARQFVGTMRSANGLVHWVNSNNGSAAWCPGFNYVISKEVLYIQLHSKFDILVVHEGDWIIQKQNGVFTSQRPEDFALNYEQV